MARGDAEQHLAVRRGGRVLLGAAEDNNNGGKRQPATGNWAWFTSPRPAGGMAPRHII